MSLFSLLAMALGLMTGLYMRKTFCALALLGSSAFGYMHDGKG
jgi:hypothetical protein